jgi:hypothetical protein
MGVLIRWYQVSNTVTLSFVFISQVVSATSFHHGESAGATSNNALLHASTARTLKTETSIGCDEFEEFEFRDREDDEAPSDVNEQVTLVFGLKETKVSAFDNKLCINRSVY